MQYAEQIIRRIKADDFVQYKDNKLIYKGGPISVDLSAANPSSMTHMIKIAYASAIDGTGFTLTNDDLLDYVAWAVLPADEQNSHIICVGERLALQRHP